MSLDNKIRAISGSHSIKEAVISVFLANPIIKPERFQALIEKEFKDKFQQFEAISTVQIQIKNDKGTLENSTPQLLNNVGFKFSNFKKGVPTTVIQGLNESNRSFISYHSLSYSSWDIFFSDCKNCFEILNQLQTDIFITAFSLHYIDEFLWIDEDNVIDTTVVFNKFANNIPKEFFNSSNTDFNLTTERVEGKYKYFDRLAIKVEPAIKPIISISHNVTQPLKEVISLSDLIKSNTFNEILEVAHNHNKKLLGDILTPEVKQLIKL